MTTTYDLRGKNALVVGGLGGIGSAIVRLLATSGAQVVVWDEAEKPASGHGSAKVDVTDHSLVGVSADAFIADVGRLDILIVCVGYLGKSQQFLDHAPADWEKIIRTNLIGTMNVVQALAPHMAKQGAGVIITFGSLAGKEGLGGLAAYSAASGGVISFTKAVGRELAGTGVRVNCIAPGPVDTEMIRQLGRQSVETMIAESPMRRLGEAEEVAHLAVWLCSDASRFNTGAVFDMSGGRARY